MIAWWWGLALAGSPDFVRDGRAVRGGRLALTSLQVEGFAGGLFRDPDGAPVDTPPFPDVDLDAVAARARRALVQTARKRSLEITDAPAAREDPPAGPVGTPPGFTAGTWDGFVPGELQALLAPDRAADGVLVVRISLGWCPGPDGDALCVRARDEELGSGVAGAIGYLFLRRLDLLGGTLGAQKPTTVLKRYRYTRLDDSVYADRPILGRGETLQAQAEDAAVQAARALIAEAARPPR